MMSEQDNIPTEGVSSSAEDGKVTAIVAYITIIGLIIAFILNSEKKNSFASFHIGQMVGLTISEIVIWILGFIPFIGPIIYWIGSIFLFILWIIGIASAINLKEKPVPVLGEKFQEWFGNI